jgi:DcmR-like sensory protein
MTSSIAAVPHANGTSVFWGELPPCEHVAQFYTDDGVLLESLTSFAGGGLKAGESVILIATPEHLECLQERLMAAGIDVNGAIDEGRYIVLDAEETLASFMVKDWPDKELFGAMVEGLIRRATANGRTVRAFGEMVALLWARGQLTATVRLEYLWHQFCKSHEFALFCAYPKAGFTKSPKDSLAEICAAHSRVIEC